MSVEDGAETRVLLTIRYESGISFVNVYNMLPNIEKIYLAELKFL
jgi:hypothetical protein